MRLDDLILTLDRADALDQAYKTRACLSMSYPKQRGRLTLPDQLVEFDRDADEQVFEAALKASGLMPIVEHLYPLPVSQAQ
jgi:hypothetical protein